MIYLITLSASIIVDGLILHWVTDGPTKSPTGTTSYMRPHEPQTTHPLSEIYKADGGPITPDSLWCGARGTVTTSSADKCWHNPGSIVLVEHRYFR